MKNALDFGVTERSILQLQEEVRSGKPGYGRCGKKPYILAEVWQKEYSAKAHKFRMRRIIEGSHQYLGVMNYQNS